ncbi:MAG: aldo/keto reductase [Burkholderiales bacterium]|nr:aldo/keto reductase [Burkholderiales bacterium]
MKYKHLGASGLEVSTLTLGTMTFGERTGAAEAHEIVAHARDAGVTFIDTADAYVMGESERIVGAAIRAERNHWVLATKVGNRMADERNNGGSSRAWILRACDASLARLSTDRIDVYYLHRDDPSTPLDESVGAMGDLIRVGKVRYFGVSNFRGWRIAETVAACRRNGVPAPIVCQPSYNLLNRMPEVEILPACDHYGLGVAPYSPIARGILTGKYAPGAPPPPDSRVERNDRRMMETEFRAESLAIAQTLKAHAEATGRTATQFALAWLWANPIVTTVIAGPRTLAQWQDYADAVGTAWSADDEALVDELVRPGHPSTPGYHDPRHPFYGRKRRER